MEGDVGMQLADLVLQAVSLGGGKGATVSRLVLQHEANVSFEADIQQDPYDVSTWVSYALANAKSPAVVRNAIFERAVRHLPGSYKLWHMYLRDRLRQVEVLSIVDPQCDAASRVCENALATMHKMPRIWQLYLKHLLRLKRVTSTRRAFDYALRSLPVTQHEHVWPLFRSFAEQEGVPVSTGNAVFRRMVQLHPEAREAWAEYLERMGRPAEAARQWAVLVDDPLFSSAEGRTLHEMWMRLCDLVSSYPLEVLRAGGLPLSNDAQSADEVSTSRVERVFRAGVRKFSDEVGRLWCALAKYHVKLGQFEQARDVYDEAMLSVMTVRDFSTVYDACTQFAESMVEARVEQLAEAEAREGVAGGASEVPPAPKLSDAASLARELFVLETSGVVGPPASLAPATRGMSRAMALQQDIELRLERLSALVERRPLLLSSVLLRQNPHNVREWSRRAGIYRDQGKQADVVRTLGEALETVDPWKASGGRVRELWAELAREYETSGAKLEPPDYSGARRVFERAVGAPAREAGDVAWLWCAWAEMELRLGDPKRALRVMERAVTRPRKAERRVYGESETVSLSEAASSAASDASVSNASPHVQAHKSPKSWALYLDLQEAVGTPESVTEAYEQALSLKVATTRMVLSFADWLRKRGYFEKAFRAYEQGVATFPWPNVSEVWAAYISLFVERYAGTKLERARELFEKAVGGAPPEQSKEFWLLYAAVEEKYGSVRRAMEVLDRGTKQVCERDRAALFRRWAVKAEEFYGAAAARPVWERACDECAPADAVRVCMDFAGLEARLGELDRARALYSHAAQFVAQGASADDSEALWSAWKDFELAHGNRETYRDMAVRRRAVGVAGTQAGGFTEEELVDKAKRMNVAQGGDGDIARNAKRQRETPASLTAEEEPELEEEPAAKAVKRDDGGYTKDAAARDEDELDIGDV
jgi:pre-mRNA-splicing factor SYF1